MKVVLTVLAACIAFSAAAEIGARPLLHTYRLKLGASLLKQVRDGGNANEYMDQVLDLLRQQMIDNGLDNIALPDGSLAFSQHVPLIGDVTGGAYLHDGFLKGMQTIQRAGDATLSYDGTTVIFESMCGINNAAMGYALSIKFMDIGPTGSMAGTITYIHFYFKVHVDITKAEAVIDVFDVKDIGHISTDISGLGPFNWLAEVIADLAINLVKGVIKELIEGPIRAIMNSIIQSIIDSLLPTPAPLRLIL